MIYAGANSNAVVTGWTWRAFCYVFNSTRECAEFDSPSKERFYVLGTLADPGPILADLELGSLYVKDLRSLCSRLNFTTTGGRAALIKCIEKARHIKHSKLSWHSSPNQVCTSMHVESNTWNLHLNCNSNNFSDKSKSYWTGSNHKTGFYQQAN